MATHTRGAHSRSRHATKYKTSPETKPERKKERKKQTHARVHGDDDVADVCVDLQVEEAALDGGQQRRLAERVDACDVVEHLARVVRQVPGADARLRQDVRLPVVLAQHFVVPDRLPARRLRRPVLRRRHGPEVEAGPVAAWRTDKQIEEGEEAGRELGTQGKIRHRG